ncbi:hypothetical protein K503DRAFT_777322 [Rhizopogon vinicolor AM-OR11-026]|uniref:Uncharacterized protein n=1 Tax=Rhizopogon vinicolor AM-OR11-026 TaxID=1314800 RepID=A0A1B7MGM5_9AGAM|nr:hypothetical protein K503DRAFT_777322 [Rhizopogon vinicolor AM-OR11-026]
MCTTPVSSMTTLLITHLPLLFDVFAVHRNSLVDPICSSASFQAVLQQFLMVL